MTILGILEKALGGTADLTKILDEVGSGTSDLAPTARTLRDRLETELQGVDLAGVAHAVTGELADIAQGHFHPRRHPSDGA